MSDKSNKNSKVSCLEIIIIIILIMFGRNKTLPPYLLCTRDNTKSQTCITIIQFQVHSFEIHSDMNFRFNSPITLASRFGSDLSMFLMSNSSFTSHFTCLSCISIANNFCTGLFTVIGFLPLEQILTFAPHTMSS